MQSYARFTDRPRLPSKEVKLRRDCSLLVDALSNPRLLFANVRAM